MHLWNYRTTTIKKTVDKERSISLILFLKSQNSYSDIHDSFMYSPSKNRYPQLTRSWAPTKLAAVVELCSALLSAAVLKPLSFSHPQTDTFPQMQCACLCTLQFWLFANFSLHIKHSGKPAEVVVKASGSGHALFNSQFSFWRFWIYS